MLRAAIQRPIAVSMLFLALVLIGAISYTKLPVDLLPSIVYPRLTVITTYEDVPAEDLERMVTQPLEEVMTAMTGVRRVVSRTREGVSMVTVEYEWGTQMDFANLHLRESIDRVAFRDDFPEAAERPLILRWDPTSRPISVLVLKGTDRIEALTDFAREVVKPALEQVEGISQAEVVGGADREIVVQPEPEKLAIFGITVEEVRAAVASSNVSFPGGRIRQGPFHLSLRIDGEYQSLAEIADTEIQRPGQASLRISDVAQVLDTVKEPEGTTLLGESEVVSLLIYKEPEANTIRASRRIDTALDVLSQDYGGFEYDFVYRDADYVRASFDGLTQSLKLGAILAFVVLLFFLRDLRTTLVVGLSIPVSLLIAFALLYFGGVKLNLMSLGGLSLAVGMLVDSAIVVLENISRHAAAHRGRGAAGSSTARAEGLLALQVSSEAAAVAEACATGTSEVARAVLASTLTTIAVFFPVVYVPGIAGAFFRDQALAVTFSLLVSAATALLLQPVLAARIMKIRSPRPLAPWQKRLRWPLDAFDAGFQRFAASYHRVLERALLHRNLLLLALPLGLVLCGLIAMRLERSFMPERTSGDLRVDLELPAGTPLEETKTAVTRLIDWIESDPAVRTTFTQVGRTERTLAAMQDYTAPNTARLRVFLTPGRHAHSEGERLHREFSEHLAAIPGVVATFKEEGIGLGEILATGESDFAVGVLAEDPRDALRFAEQLQNELEKIPGLVDLGIDRVLGTTNVVVRLDREEILRAGQSPEVIARELRNRIAGVAATTFNEVEQRIDIAVRLAEDERRDLGLALASPVQLAGGRSVPLRSFLEIEEERPVRELVRRNQRRMVTLSGDVRGRALDAIWKDAQRVLDETSAESQVTFVRAGEDVEMRKSFQDLLWAMLLAIILVYMILAAQFESFLDPLLVAGVIPIGLAGAALAIWITRGSINILSLIGVIALLGIAVNDAIVKIDTIRRLRAEGLSGVMAILEASRLRLRPILMTSLTTILAMAPMAWGMGGGEQLQRPLAITIIGGLLLTTATTLIYTPLLYHLAHRLGRER